MITTINEFKNSFNENNNQLLLDYKAKLITAFKTEYRMKLVDIFQMKLNNTELKFEILVSGKFKDDGDQYYVWSSVDDVFPNDRIDMERIGTRGFIITVTFANAVKY